MGHLEGTPPILKIFFTHRSRYLSPSPHHLQQHSNCHTNRQFKMASNLSTEEIASSVWQARADELATCLEWTLTNVGKDKAPKPLFTVLPAMVNLLKSTRELQQDLIEAKKEQVVKGEAQSARDADQETREKALGKREEDLKKLEVASKEKEVALAVQAVHIAGREFAVKEDRVGLAKEKREVVSQTAALLVAKEECKKNKLQHEEQIKRQRSAIKKDRGEVEKERLALSRKETSLAKEQQQHACRTIALQKLTQALKSATATFDKDTEICAGQREDAASEQNDARDEEQVSRQWQKIGALGLTPAVQGIKDASDKISASIQQPSLDLAYVGGLKTAMDKIPKTTRGFGYQNDSATTMASGKASLGGEDETSRA